MHGRGLLSPRTRGRSRPVARWVAAPSTRLDPSVSGVLPREASSIPAPMAWLPFYTRKSCTSQRGAESERSDAVRRTELARGV